MVALVDRDDPHHARCAAALDRISSEDFVTTWPCLTEAMYLLGKRRGFIAQEDLWGYVDEGVIKLYQPSLREWERIHTLMRQYRDTPMDLADASLVVAGEQLDLARIFTTDSHFQAYRMHGREAFDVIP
ncbi:MAG TPA: PIN domain-containing protein [Longimicrobium sp.]|nr:PIN domain-containing protein [Longimicrobium sp.]